MFIIAEVVFYGSNKVNGHRSLEAKDALGQSVVTPARAMTLPGRRFFDPLAAALIEQRRDLMWHRENAGRVERMLKAILFEPGSQIRKEGDYLQLRFISAELTKALAQGALKQARVEIADLLWALAIDLEDVSERIKGITYWTN